MLNLVPSYTYDYRQLLTMVAGRNAWFIKTRFLFGAALLAFILTVNSILDLHFSEAQIWAIIIISVTILLYNIIFFYIARSEIMVEELHRFNQLHFAFIQMMCDLLALGVLTYFTGGIESPFYIFFIFHMIIGSMILPGYLVYSMAAATVLFVLLFSFLEYFLLIPHHGFGNLIVVPLYNNILYILISSSSFGIMMMLSVFLANNIASSHYRREQELKIALEKLDEAEKVKQKYTMGIVHEIKSPVVAVRSNLDLILQNYVGPVSEVVRDKLLRARERTEEAVLIINDVLNVSRLKLLESLSFELHDIKNIIENTLSKKSSAAEYSGITINFRDNRKNIVNIPLDRGLIELALSNVIGNAVKYNLRGGIIDIILSDIGHEYIKVEVCDNGIGIPEKEQGKVFTDFYRASNAKKLETEGSGLGLSVVKQIIEQHGGSVSLISPSGLSDSSERPGTCFILTIPVSPPLNKEHVN